MKQIAKSSAELCILIIFVGCLVNFSCGHDLVVGQSCSVLRPGSKYANPENCRTYMICNGGVIELEFCPSGFYNPQKDKCDLNHKCILDNVPDVTGRFDETSTLPIMWTSSRDESISSTTSMDLTNTESTSTMFEETDWTTELTTETTQRDSTPVALETSTMFPATTVGAIDQYTCPSIDTDQPTYLTDKQDCEKFFLCYHSKAIAMRCISGMYWNPETRMCDFAKNVKCPEDGNPDASPLPKCISNRRYSMPHPSRCEYFIMCMDGAQTIQQCDAFHHWDVITNKCLIKDQATCIVDISSSERLGLV